MASASFRDSMSSLGWSRRDNDLPVRTGPSASTPILSTIQQYNPFSHGAIRLPTSEPGAPLPAPSAREEREGYFALSRWDRILVFGGLNLAALALFVVCFTLFPVMAMKPRKFAILWTMASVLFISSWAVMMGPVPYVKHLTSGPRLPFTAAYFGSIALTLYFSLGLKSTLLTLLSSIAQLLALVWYLVSYFPMGSQGLRFAANVGTSRVAAWMTG